MTIRTDVTIDWNSSPRILTVADPSTEFNAQDIVDTCRYLEDRMDGITQPILVDAAGKEYLGGTTYVGITLTLQNALIAFEARGGPSWVLCDLLGGNIVAVDSDGDPMDPRQPTAYVSCDRTASASATLQEQDAIQYSSYDGGVTIDTGSGYSGSEYPTGTPQQPVDNLSDALLIAAERGFNHIYVKGTLAVTSGDIDGYTFIGDSAAESSMSVAPAVSSDGTKFRDLFLTATLDGDNDIERCMLYDVTYNGAIKECGLGGNIIFTGTADNVISFSFTYDQDNPPIIDMGGSGNSLSMPHYMGIATIKNLTDDTQEIGIGLAQGKIIIDSTVSAGPNHIISGVGICEDNSTGTAVVNVDGLLNQDTVSDAIWNNEDGLFMQKIVKNKKTLEKSGSVWSLIIYDDDDTTPILEKELKDKNGDDITDLEAGTLAMEMASGV